MERIPGEQRARPPVLTPGQGEVDEHGGCAVGGTDRIQQRPVRQRQHRLAPGCGLQQRAGSSPAAARARVWHIVFSLAALTPRSLSTRQVSRIEVGSTTRAIIRSRNTITQGVETQARVHRGKYVVSIQEDVTTTRRGATEPR